MNTVKLITTIIATLALMLATSLLYEINFIKAWWPRWVCVIILMMLELMLGFIVSWQIISTIINQQKQ